MQSPLRPGITTSRHGAGKTPPLRMQYTDTGVLSHDIVMGANTDRPARCGIWGRTSEHQRLVAADMNLAHAYLMIGSPGSGKSLCAQVLLEMALQQHPHLWHGKRPMAAAAFHFARDEEYHAEFPWMHQANDDQVLIDLLRTGYAAEPMAHSDVLVIAPSIMVPTRSRYYGTCGVEVKPFLFSMDELEADHLKLLIGAYGDNSATIARMNHLIWKKYEEQKTETPRITLDELEKWMLDSPLPTATKDDIGMRIAVARLFVHDGPSLRSYMRPGRALVFDMRCKAITAEQTFALGVVAMQTCSAARDPDGKPLSKLLLVDEAHNVMTPQAAGITSVLLDKTRTRRHQYLSLAISTQDPMGIDPRQIELMDHVQIFRTDTSKWLDRISDHCLPFKGVDPYEIQSLATGECLLWSSKSNESDFRRKPMRMRVRPTATKPGGTTLTDTGQVIGH